MVGTPVPLSSPTSQLVSAGLSHVKTFDIPAGMLALVGGTAQYIFPDGAMTISDPNRTWTPLPVPSAKTSEGTVYGWSWRNTGASTVTATITLTLPTQSLNQAFGGSVAGIQDGQVVAGARNPTGNTGSTTPATTRSVTLTPTQQPVRVLNFVADGNGGALGTADSGSTYGTSPASLAVAASGILTHGFYWRTADETQTTTPITVGSSTTTGKTANLAVSVASAAPATPTVRFGGYFRLHARRSLGIQAAAYLGAPPAGTGNITHGDQVTAANTGLTSNASSLTSSGVTTYSTSGQTITGLDFTAPVTISGDNVTLRNCRITVAATGTGFENGLTITGTGVTVENVQIVAPDGTSMYHCVYINPNATGTILRRVDASRGENLVTSYATGVVLEECYLHDTSIASRPDGHEDGVECYAGSMIARRCKVTMGAGTRDGAFNIGSYASGGPASGADVDYCHVLDSYLDGGNAHVLLDDAKSGGIGTRNVRVLRCKMGGHTNVGVHGRYKALQNNDARTIVSTQADQTSNPLAIWWPTSGADASTWTDCADLTPNRTGELITSP